MSDENRHPHAAQSRRILVVEDNPGLATCLRLNLEYDGHEVLVEHDGKRAFVVLHAFHPELVILDVMLPGMDGFELLRRWRATDKTTRVIVLSAKADEADRVRGLRLGADDYVTKPFSLTELLERINRQLYRLRPLAKDNVRIIQLGTASVDLAARTVSRDGQTKRLGPKEFALLSALLDAQGAAVPKQEILSRVWGHKAPIRTNTVEYHIASLRSKIEEDPRHPRHILTVSKVGYRLRVRD